MCHEWGYMRRITLACNGKGLPHHVIGLPVACYIVMDHVTSRCGKLALGQNRPWTHFNFSSLCDALQDPCEWWFKHLRAVHPKKLIHFVSQNLEISLKEWKHWFVILVPSKTVFFSKIMETFLLHTTSK
jgi:hypothetical protein